MDEREAYIALNMMDGVGPVSVRTLAGALGGAAGVLLADRAALQRVPGVARDIVARILTQRDTVDVGAEQAHAAQLGARIVTMLDEEYPGPLKTIHDPPLALYVRGTLELKDKHAIAVVGTRRASHYARAAAERLAAQLTRAGFVVISGLARGVDTAAHQGALKAGGRTLAVLGSALDRLYPPENAGLAEKAAADGAVLSEFRFGTEPGKTTFPMRNRIVSGLSMGVLVVEAGLKSGAMITARSALEQGRAVFAVPGRIDSPGSKGTHQLIRDGARLVEGIDDITAEFEFLLPATGARAAERPAPSPALSEQEARLVDTLEQEGEMDVDALSRRLGVPAAGMSALLLGLEMKRVVRMLPGRVVQRVR